MSELCTKLTAEQVTYITQIIKTSKDFLDQQTEEPSRFSKLTAYDWLTGSLIPVGYVPKDEDGITICGIRRDELKSVIDIIENIIPTPCEEETEDGGEEEDNCRLLIDAINNIDVGIDIDQLRVELENTLNIKLPPVSVEINNFTDASKTAIIAAILDVQNNLNQNINQIDIGINAIRTELREARECCHRLEENNRDQEILERIQDTRTELREARECCHRVEDCLQVMGCDDNFAGLIGFILAALTPIFTQLEVNLTNLINTKCGDDGDGGSSDVDLTGIIAQLNGLDLKITNIEGDITTVKNCCNTVDTDLDNVTNTINNIVNNIDQISNDISTVNNSIQNLETTVNNDNDIINNNINNVSNQVSNLTTTNNVVNNNVTNVSNQVTNLGDTIENVRNITRNIQNIVNNGSPVDLTQAIALLNQIKECTCTELEGDRTIIQCSDLTDEGYIEVVQQYGGSPGESIGEQLAIITEQVNDVAKGLCEIKKKQDDQGCIVVLPGDDVAEIQVPKQLSIDLIPVDMTGKKYANYKREIHIPYPIDNIDWCTHIEPFRYFRGKVTGRVNWNLSKIWSGSSFRDEDEAQRICAAIDSLSILESKNPGTYRITKGGSPVYNREIIEYRAVRAVVIELDLQGRIASCICLKRPVRGC